MMGSPLGPGGNFRERKRKMPLTTTANRVTSAQMVAVVDVEWNSSNEFMAARWLVGDRGATGGDLELGGMVRTQVGTYIGFIHRDVMSFKETNWQA